MEWHVFPPLAKAIIVLATFDLLMSQDGFDTFALVVKYINKKWEPCYDIGIFEVHKTSRVVPWLYNFATCYGHAMSKC
jgi:hypothetical protein